MNRQICIMGLVLAWTGTSGASPPASTGCPRSHHLVDMEEATPSESIARTTFTVQDGRNAFNQFKVVRLQASVSSEDEPVILLSPFGFPAEFWELSDDGSYEDAFAPQVALAGYDVWLVDSRSPQADPGECESGAVDCSAMAEWDIQTSIDDALFVKKMVNWAVPGSKPVLGGLSGGASTALATINKAPNKFSGLFMWEGTLYSEDPVIQARNAAFCEAEQELFDQGVYYDASVQDFQSLFGLASSAPNDPTPIPAFPPGTTNLQALLFVFTVPDPNNPLNFTDDFIRFVGDPFAGTLTYSNLDKIFRWGELLGNYLPLPFLLESHCAMGGIDTRFTGRLDKFRGKALLFAEGRGFNTMMLDTATLMTSADVTVDYQHLFGEADRYFHVDWETYGLNPFLTWLASP